MQSQQKKKQQKKNCRNIINDLQNICLLYMTSFLFSKKKNLVHDKNDIKCILEKKKKKKGFAVP